MFTNTGEFPQLISSLVWTHTEDYPMNTTKKSQNEMINETLFLLISTAFSALWVRFETCFGKGLQHFFVFGGRKKMLGGKCWWRTETPTFMKTKDKEIPRTWALIKSKHHLPSPTQRIQGNFLLGTEVPREWLPWCQPSFEVDHYKDQGCGNIEHEVYIK